MELFILIFVLMFLFSGAITVGFIALPVLLLCFFTVPALFLVLPKVLAWFVGLIGLLWLFDVHPLLFFIALGYIFYVDYKQKRRSTRQLLQNKNFD